MRRSLFLFFSFLIFALWASTGSGAKTAAESPPELYEVTESVSAPQHSDYLAVETFQLSVPSPARALRKGQEKEQKDNRDTQNSYPGQYHSSAHDHPACVMAVSSAADRQSLPSHEADYLMFGMLVI